MSRRDPLYGALRAAIRTGFALLRESPLNPGRSPWQEELR
jgi:hypothetical protein